MPKNDCWTIGYIVFLALVDMPNSFPKQLYQGMPAPPAMESSNCSVVLNYISLMNNNVEHLLFFQGVLVQVFFLILQKPKLPVFQLLISRSSLHTLDMSPSLVTYIANIVFQPIACPFTLLILSLDEQVSLHLMQSTLSIFYGQCFCVLFKKYLLSRLVWYSGLSAGL